MGPRIRGAWIAAGIAVLGAMIAGAEARAGTAGITIKGGFKPTTGDPPYDYIFEVYIDPGFEVEAGAFNNFQVTDLVGVTSGSLSSQPGSIPTVIWTPTPATENITWTFLGNTSIPNNTTSDLYLGEFTVQTTENFPNGPPVSPGTLIDYNFTVFDLSTNQTVSGSNSFPIVNLGVPEPTSVVLLAVGAAILPAIAARRGRRTARTA